MLEDYSTTSLQGYESASLEAGAYGNESTRDHYFSNVLQRLREHAAPFLNICDENAVTEILLPAASSLLISEINFCSHVGVIVNTPRNSQI